MSEWQVLDVGSIWMKEFASALSKMERVVAWAPRMSFAARPGVVRRRTLADPPLEILEFPLQRGYARAPLRWLAPYERPLLKQLLAHASDPATSPLLCSTPFYAPLAELWPGPIVYYVTDLTIAYPSLDPTQVLALDRRMCRVATSVCPNSRRIAAYLTRDAACDPRRITIVPNATRAANVPTTPQIEPTPLPADAADLSRPVVGVLGDLSGNLNWTLLADAIRQTPFVSWLFVGPATRPIRDPRQSAAREWVKTHARFVGMKPYGDLQRYARSVDAAVLPYLNKEPTYSGSSTRFYEHLAAGRPMIATRGFAELLEKVPLVTLVDTAEELAAALAWLHARDFHDGHEAARLEASRFGTWEVRARTIANLVHPHAALATA